MDRKAKLRIFGKLLDAGFDDDIPKLPERSDLQFCHI